MKCPKCNVNYSERVYKIHISRCDIKKVESFKDLPEATEENKDETILVETETNEHVKAEDLNIKQDDYSFEQLLQMALESPDRKEAPSTIKRWKEDRLRKELGL